MQIIDNTANLEQLCNRLAAHSFITVDLEFIREKTYFPLLCLIQVASETEAAIIDPLAEGIDLGSFFSLMKNPDVVKVFHSCRQDVEIIFELSGIIPQPLFDTQVAAMVCGFGESISYERLVKAILDIELDKTDRLSNWQLRPLDEHQLEYAAGDVTHLIKIYRHLTEQMTRLKRTGWIDEEMQILGQGTTYIIPPEEAWLKIRHRSHNAKVLSALRDLAAWREMRARDKNVPRQSIVKDDFLIMIATACPKNKEELMNIRGMRKDVATGRLADEILDVLEHMKVDPKLVKQTRHDNINGIPALAELLKMLLKIVAQREGVVPRLIAGETELQKLAAFKDKDNPALRGWRHKIFGARALKLRNGELNIRYDPEKKDIEFIEISRETPGESDH